MPPDPPRGYRLWWAFIQTPLHEILDPPQEIPLENAGNGICKTLDFKGVLGVGVPTIFYWEQIRKVNFWQCRRLNSFCFQGLCPLDPQQGFTPVPRWGRQPPPDPSLVWRPSAPIASTFKTSPPTSNPIDSRYLFSSRKTNDKLYMSLSANTIVAKLTNHV